MPSEEIPLQLQVRFYLISFDGCLFFVFIAAWFSTHVGDPLRDIQNSDLFLNR